MELRWKQTKEGWQLEPAENVNRSWSEPVVVKKDGHFWNIYMRDRALAPGNYTSEIGAKRDAWEFAYQKRKALFGTYSLKLSEVSCSE